MWFALHLVFCLCNFQVSAKSSKVRGWYVLALKRNQIVYVVRVIQSRGTNSSKFIFLFFFFPIFRMEVHEGRIVFGHQIFVEGLFVCV
jgi:hypothetical protein